MRLLPLALLCLASTPALAADWKAVGSQEKGHAVCGLSLTLEDKDKRFELRYAAGAETFSVALARAGWRIAHDPAHEAMLRFDGHAPWTVTLVKGAFTLPVEQLGRFVLEFRDSNTFTVLVREPSPTGWAAGLAGSGVAGDAFLHCSRELL